MLEIESIAIRDYGYKYIQFDFMFTEESWYRERKDIVDTAEVPIAIKNVGYRELYDLYLGDFDSYWFKEQNKNYYHMKPLLYESQSLYLNIMFYEMGRYDNDKFEEKYNTMSCPLRFYCYFKDCYDNWYRQKAEVSFIFNVQKDITLENRALDISFERGEILSAPEEMDEKLLPWKQGAMICEC